MNKEFIKKINQAITKTIYSSSLKNVGIYTLANFINGAIPFFLLPVLTRYLTPEDYGITATFTMLIFICTPFINFNTHLAISIKYFKMQKSEFSQYVSNCLLITVISFFIVTIFFIVFNTQIKELSLFPGNWLWAITVICFANSIIYTLLTIFRLALKVYPYVTIQLFQTVLNVGLSVYFVVWLGMDWQGRISANIVTIIFFAFVSVIILYKKNYLVFKFNFTYIKDIIKLGVPLFTNNIFYLSLASIDRLIIAKIVGLKELGIYSVGTNFSIVITVIIVSINSAYVPWLFNKLSMPTEKVKSKIVFLFYGYMISVLILAITTSCIMPIIIKYFIDAKFYGVIQIIFLLFIAQAFAGMDIMMSNFINYAERTRFYFPVDIFTSLFYFIISYVLIKTNGIIGAAQALLTIRFIRFLLIWIVSNKAYPMPWFNFYKNIYK
jgi:O-antigen/teichoic acid export membrane protein